VNIPERIVETLLEADDNIDFRSFLDRNTQAMYDVWEQVDGDVDWWTYGGTFHNPGRGEMVHVAGLEGEGLKEIEHWDIELTDEEMAQINADYPVKIDPDFPEDGDENERDREMAVDSLKSHRADELNANRKVHVYQWTDDFIEDWADKFDDISNSVGERIEELELPGQWCAIGQYFGWDELDHSPTLMTRAEIEKLLTPFKDTSPQSSPPPDAP
jgi:hypothetical protein